MKQQYKSITMAVSTLCAGLSLGLAQAQTCNLSPLANQLYQAAQQAPVENHTVAPESMLSTNNQAGIALLPPYLFSSFAAALSQAQYEVDIQTFLFTAGADAVEEGLKGLKELEARLESENRQGDPVLVRFNLDSLNAFSKPVITGVYKEIIKLNLNPELIKIELATYEHRTYGANHGKSAIIDGKMAVIGGANFTEPNNLELPTFDSGYVLRGDIAGTILEEFDNAWSLSAVWDCTTGKYGKYPRCKKAGLGEPSHRAEVSQAAKMALSSATEAEACQPMMLLGHPSREALHENTDNPQDLAYLEAFAKAQNRIRIMSPNLNAPVAVEAIKQAVSRGLTVEMILSYGYEDFAEGLPKQGGTNGQVVKRLLEWIDETDPALIEKLKIRWYSHDGNALVEGKESGLESHLKYMSIDDQITIVGSANMDSQSWYQSREINVAVDSADVTNRWDSKVFEPAYNRSIPVESADIIYKPNADAGANLKVEEGSIATLNGSNSYDLDSPNLSYQWVQVAGTPVTLNNANSATPSFTTPAKDGWKSLKFELTVTDGGNNSDSDKVRVNITRKQ